MFGEDVRSAAVKGLSSLWTVYYSAESPTRIEILPQESVKQYLSLLSSERENYAHGMAMALGGLPLSLMPMYGKEILRGLLKFCSITPETATWAPGRREAINSVFSLVNGMRSQNCLSQPLLDDVLQTYLMCLEDYTTDRRGDIGAWVREAAMSALQTIFVTWPIEAEAQPSEASIKNAFTRIIQLSVERIDRTRRVAGNALSEILHSGSHCVKVISNYNELVTLLPKDLCSSLNWGNDKDTFPLLRNLLRLPDYNLRLMMGYVYSLGGVSANLAQSSADALDSYVSDVDTAGVGGFINTLLDLLEDGSDRLTLSLLKTIEHFMTASSLLDEVFYLLTSFTYLIIDKIRHCK